MTVSLATLVDAVALSLDNDALADDSYLVAVNLLGQAMTSGVEIKSVHAALVKRGYTLGLTACYGRAFAGQVLALGTGPDFKADVPAAYSNDRKLVALMVAAYNVKGGAAALRRIVGKVGQTRGGAVAEIVKFKTAPKSGAVVVTPGTVAPVTSPADAATLIRNMQSIMAGLAKISGTVADHDAAVALAASLAVWGGVPAQRVASAV